MSGIARSPKSPSVVVSHAGTVTSAASASAPSTAACTTGVVSSVRTTGVRACTSGVSTNWPIECVTKTAIASAKPGSPKAKSATGNPRLPVLPIATAGKYERTERRRALSRTSAAAAIAASSAAAAAAIARKSPSGTVSRARLSNTRHGAATFSMSRVTNSRSKGALQRRQT